MTAQDRPLYIANPDISCREEGPDGALLFNPDTDDVMVVNVTGLLIWQALAVPRTLEGVIDALRARCNNVPQDEVADHVSEFVEQMVDRGFANVRRAPG